MVTTTEKVADALSILSGDSHTQINPAVALSKSSGPSKTIVILTGTGFTPLTAIAFTFDGFSITPNEGAITSDAEGSFTCSYTIPVICVGAKNFTSWDGISNRITNVFTVNGVYALPLTDADAFTKDFLKSYKAGEVDAIVVDTSALATVLAVDARGCDKLMIQIINTHGSISLAYSIFGTCIESDTPPAFSAANYTALPDGTDTLAHGTNDIKMEDDGYSWILVQMNTATPGSNSQASVIARQKQ